MKHVCEAALEPPNNLPAEYLQIATANSATMNITVHDPCSFLMKQNRPADGPVRILDQQKWDMQ